MESRVGGEETEKGIRVNMAEEIDRKLRKELDGILRAKGVTPPDPPPCAYHRMVPPLGCILSFDMAQCDLCSFYKPVEMPKKKE